MSNEKRPNRYAREDMSSRMSSYVNEMLKKESFDPNKRINDIMSGEGRAFFHAGKALDTASSEQLANSSFVKAYISAMNTSWELYDDGFQSFVNGIRFKDISVVNQNNKYFMQGYRDARIHSLIEGIDWTVFPDKEDIEMYKKGKEWFNAGFSIDDATDDKKYNTFFINGFEKGLSDYDLGMENFIEGTALNDIPQHHKISPYFIKGYKDAHDQSLVDGIDWRKMSDGFEVNEDDTNLYRGRHK